MLHKIRQIKERIKSLIFRAKKSDQQPVAKNRVFNNIDREKIARICKMQEENNRKLRDMNLKIARTIRRIEDVKRRISNVQANDPNIGINTSRMRKDLDGKMRQMRKNGINLRNFNEFVDLREFLKFNRMNAITDEVIQKCNWDLTLKQLFE